MSSAVQLFNEIGYPATGLGDIIERAEMTKGALYYHFESKEALATAIIEEGSANLFEAFNRIRNSSAPALERIIHGLFVVADLLSTDMVARSGLQLLRAFGLPVADTAIRDFGGQRVLCVERFDRQLHPSGDWIMRLPQEDFCQVHGLPPTRKYEADGGPGVADIARILAGSERAREDVATLLQAQILFWLLAATDGHAKNFSLRLLPRGRFQLTPLYDVMSIWPIVGDAPNQVSWQKAKLAMAVAGRNRHYLLKDIQRRHFDAMARRCGYEGGAEPLIEGILARVPAAIEEVNGKLPAGFPQRVVDAIFAGVRESAGRLGRCPNQ